VLVIDGVDVPRAVEAGILGPLPIEELPLDDIFPEVRMEENNASTALGTRSPRSSATTRSRSTPRPSIPRT
jgi:hypothetical protein